VNSELRRGACHSWRSWTLSDSSPEMRRLAGGFADRAKVGKRSVHNSGQRCRDVIPHPTESSRSANSLRRFARKMGNPTASRRSTEMACLFN
jgi:hypothetical protein